MRNGNGKAALEAGRNFMMRTRTFTPADRPLLIAAGLAEDFNPIGNTIDAAIDRYLDGTLGRPWREHVGPAPVAAVTADEQDESAAAEAAIAPAQAAFDATLDALFLAEDFYRHPPETATIEQLREIGRRHDAAVRAFVDARAALERVLPKRTNAALRVDRRRLREAQARIGK